MTQGDGTPAQTRRLLLQGSAGAVSRCRDFTARALADWGSSDRGPGAAGMVEWLEVSRPSRPPWRRRPADRT